MKKFYLLILFVTSILQAQIVSIPDSAFYNRLLEANDQNGYALDVNGNPIAVDANADTLIQESEALAVFTLDLEFAGIEDLTGLQSFSNLRELRAGLNNFTSIDFSGLGSLEVVHIQPSSLTGLDLSPLLNLRDLQVNGISIGAVDVSANTSLMSLKVSGCGLSSLDVSMLPNLTTLWCDGNNLTSLDLAGNPLLEELSCRNNPISSLDLSAVPQLKKLTCSQTGLTSIDVSQNPLLTNLIINNNSISAIDLSSNPDLQVLYCGYSSISTLDISNMPGLVMLNADFAQLASLDVSQNPLLHHLSVAGNQLTELDLSSNPAISYLSCPFNQISQLDVSGLPVLNYLNCSDNYLTILDVSNNPVLCTLNANVMSTLEILLLKNGPGGCFQEYQFYECFNLEFVCVDDDEVAYFQDFVSTAQISAVVSSYCTFTPGGPFNTVSGTIRYDFESDGCNDTDPEAAFVRIDIVGAQGTGSVYTNQNGEYAVYTGDDSVTLEVVTDAALFAPLAPAPINFSTGDVSQDFCVVSQGVVPDLEVIVAPVIPARPGFEAIYNVVVRNKGNQVMTQQYGITLSYNNNFMTYNTSGQAPSSQTPGTLVWDYFNLTPFETLSIPVSFQINAPTDTPPVNNGDLLTLTGFVLPMQNDTNVIDNVFVLNQTVVGSYDPNDKACLEGSSVSVSKVGDYLHYLIRFENTGTYPAENVVVKDILNTADFDLSTLEVIDASHTVATRISNNAAEFIFQGIQLGIGGHGNILLKIRTLNTLSAGDVAQNEASIYFDYNHPIVTNLAETTFQSLSAGGPSAEGTVSVYPNPSSGTVFVQSSTPIAKIELFDIQGRLLQVSIPSDANPSIDMGAREKGIYFLRISNVEGVSVQKVMRE